MILLSLLPNHCFQNAESSNKINYKKTCNQTYRTIRQTWFGVGQHMNYSVFLSRLLGLLPHLSDNTIIINANFNSFDLNVECIF